MCAMLLPDFLGQHSVTLGPSWFRHHHLGVFDDISLSLKLARHLSLSPLKIISGSILVRGNSAVYEAFVGAAFIASQNCYRHTLGNFRHQVKGAMNLQNLI